MRVLPLLAAFLLGCPKAPLQAPPGTVVRLGAVVADSPTGPPDARDRSDGAEAAAKAVSDALTARGIAVEVVPVDGPQRERLSALAVPGRPTLVVLLESTARYSSQMSGRYRWNVEVDATLGRVGDPDRPDETERISFSVPVHLLFYHEREPEALAEAAPSIARRVARELEAWTNPEP